MKTNIVSALVLASVACFSVACVNTSPNGDMSTEEMVFDAPSISHAAQNKPAPSADQLVMQPGDLPFGASYEEWAAAYWQWALALPVDQNPLLDGACEQNQSGNVFFLAGALGGGHHRSCTIPGNKGIFIPLMSTVTRSCPEEAYNANVCQDWTSESALRDHAESTIDKANPVLRITVDGKVINVVNQYRVQSELFSDTSPENRADRLFPTCSGPMESNLCQVPAGESRDAVSDGYFVMLRPLSAGPHVIEIAANVAPDSTEQPFEIAYEILVTATTPSGTDY